MLFRSLHFLCPLLPTTSPKETQGGGGKGGNSSFFHQRESPPHPRSSGAVRGDPGGPGPGTGLSLEYRGPLHIQSTAQTVNSRHVLAGIFLSHKHKADGLPSLPKPSMATWKPRAPSPHLRPAAALGTLTPTSAQLAACPLQLGATGMGVMPGANSMDLPTRASGTAQCRPHCGPRGDSPAPPQASQLSSADRRAGGCGLCPPPPHLSQDHPQGVCF